MSIYIPPGTKKSEYFKLLRKYNKLLASNGHEDIEHMLPNGEISDMFKPTSTSLGRSSNSMYTQREHTHDSILEYYLRFEQYARDINYRFKCVKHYTTRDAPHRHFRMVLTWYLAGMTVQQAYDKLRHAVRKKQTVYSYIFFAKNVANAAKEFLQYHNDAIKMQNAIAASNDKR
jgi:hypothetical protein